MLDAQTKMMQAEQRAAKAREQQWQAEDDARTLKRAAEIQNDRTRMGRAATHVKKELEALQTAHSALSKKSAPPKAAPKTKAPTKAKAPAGRRK